MITATPTLADTSLEVKCYSNEEFFKTVEKVPAITVFSSKTKDGKIKEIMIEVEKRELYTVQYDSPPDGNATASKQYCVTSVDTDVNLNTNAIEFFNKMIDKFKGQKT